MTEILPYLITGGLGVIGILITAFITRRGQGLTNQDAMIGRLVAEVVALRNRVDVLERHDRVKDDYIEELRMHIIRGDPPPPPPYPTMLVIRDEGTQ